VTVEPSADNAGFETDKLVPPSVIWTEDTPQPVIPVKPIMIVPFPPRAKDEGLTLVTPRTVAGASPSRLVSGQTTELEGEQKVVT